MKKLILLPIVALVAFSACNFTTSNAQNSNETAVITDDGSSVITRTEQVAAFDKLIIAIPAEVTYEIGDPKVVIVGKKRVLDNIEVKQDEYGCLTVGTNGNKLRSLRDTRIYVTSDYLSLLTINGAADFESKHGIVSRGDFELTVNGAADVEIDGLKADDVSLTCNGAGDFDVEGLKADNVEVTVNGAGDASLSGKVKNAILTINGAGDIDAKELQAESIRPSVRGVGSIETR